MHYNFFDEYFYSERKNIHNTVGAGVRVVSETLITQSNIYRNNGIIDKSCTCDDNKKYSISCLNDVMYFIICFI